MLASAFSCRPSPNTADPKMSRVLDAAKGNPVQKRRAAPSRYACERVSVAKLFSPPQSVYELPTGECVSYQTHPLVLESVQQFCQAFDAKSAQYDRPKSDSPGCSSDCIGRPNQLLPGDKPGPSRNSVLYRRIFSFVGCRDSRWTISLELEMVLGRAPDMRRADGADSGAHVIRWWRFSVAVRRRSATPGSDYQRPK